MTDRNPVGLAVAAFASGWLALAPSVTQAQERRVAAADPQLVEASRALSRGDADEAVQLATRALKRRPADPAMRLLLARAHLARGDLDLAYQELDRVLRRHPRHVDALYYMGFVSARLAEREFQRLVDMAPQSARVHQLEAEALVAQDRQPAAEASYEAALKIRPVLLEALLGLAKLKRMRLACDEAAALYESAESIRPTFDGAYGLGVCYGYLDRDREAAVQFERATERDPHAAVAWVGLGTSLTKLGRRCVGFPCLQRAIALEPEMGEAHYALGLAYRAANQPQLAQAAFRKAQELAGSASPGAGSNAPASPQ